MSDAEAEQAFAKVRWPETKGQPVCPSCGGLNAYDCRRPNGAPRFRCRACKGDFSITSGTLFASHKMPLRAYLAAIAIFCNEVKGKCALALSRDLGMSYKAAFVLCHKLREAMAEELKGRTVGGDGKVAEVDGGYFGGYVKPRNLAENRIDRRLARNQNGKRRVVVIVRERNGNSVPAVFRSEGQAQSWIKARAPRTRRADCRRSDQLAKTRAPFAQRKHPLGPPPLRLPKAKHDLQTPHRLARDDDPFQLRQLLGRQRRPEIAILAAKKLRDALANLVLQPMVRRPAPLARNQPRGSLLPIRTHQPLDLPNPQSKTRRHHRLPKRAVRRPR